MYKSVLVTGAAGTIGSEIVRQLLNTENLEKIILNDLSEFSLFELMYDLIKMKENGTLRKDVKLCPLLGDISTIIKNGNLIPVDCIFHAAAYKHVGLSMENPLIYYNNNIYSTLNLIEFAKKYSIKIVHISTDKAVEPCNHMGYSKRICEMLYFTKTNQDLYYKIVRFGNVLNSKGSVIPIFQKQIRQGGPVTVTDPRATRFFMSISDAVHLVLNSCKTKPEQKILILDMGPPHSIDSLAKNLIEQAGLRVVKRKNDESEIEVKYIGLRLGEKLIEKLSYGVTLSSELKNIMYSDEDRQVQDSFIESILKHIAKCDLKFVNNIDWATCKWIE